MVKNLKHFEIYHHVFAAETPLQNTVYSAVLQNKYNTFKTTEKAANISNPSSVIKHHSLI